VGTVDGWTSPALPFLQDPQLSQGYNSSNNTFYHIITDDEASWIGSLAPLGALIGAIPAGYLANILGRRQLLLFLAAPLLFGWMTIIIAQDSVCSLFQYVNHFSAISDLVHYTSTSRVPAVLLLENSTDAYISYLSFLSKRLS
jgi:MFS family permease